MNIYLFIAKTALTIFATLTLFFGFNALLEGDFWAGAWAGIIATVLVLGIQGINIASIIQKKEEAKYNARIARNTHLHSR